MPADEDNNGPGPRTCGVASLVESGYVRAVVPCGPNATSVSTMNGSLVAILIAAPGIAIFFLFVLLPRLRRHEAEQKRKRQGPMI